MLFRSDNQGTADLWWQNQVTWCAEIQRKQRFRESSPDQAYCLYLEEENENPIWKIKNENVNEYEPVSDITNIDVTPAQGNQAWLVFNIHDQYGYLVEQLEKPLSYISRCFGEVRLPDYENQINEWYYSPELGAFRELNEEPVNGKPTGN